MDGGDEHRAEPEQEQPVRGTIQVGTRRSFVNDQSAARSEQPSVSSAPTPPPVEIVPKNQPARPRLPRPAIMHNLPKGVPGPRLDLEIALVVVVVVLTAITVHMADSRHALQQQVTKLNAQITQINNNPQTLAQKQSQTIIAKVGALMTLPANETPTVAAVSDAAAAKKQSSFFNLAQNGDIVLLYPKAGQAILYRPSTNKIVLVAPLNFTGGSGSSTAK